MYRVIEIRLRHFVEFCRHCGAVNIHQIGWNLGKRNFLAKNLLKQNIFGGTGSKASVNQDLLTDCLTNIKTKELNSRCYFTPELISTGLI